MEGSRRVACNSLLCLHRPIRPGLIFCSSLTAGSAAGNLQEPYCVSCNMNECGGTELRIAAACVGTVSS